MVQHKTAEDFAREKGMKYYEISAKEGRNVDEMFVKLGEEHVQRIDDDKAFS